MKAPSTDNASNLQAKGTLDSKNATSTYSQRAPEETGGDERRTTATTASTKRGRSPRPFLYGILIVVVLLVGYRAWQADLPSRIVTSLFNGIIELTALAGFQTNDIVFTGLERLDANELQITANLSKGAPIFGLSLGEIRNSLAKRSWISSVKVMRQLPDRLIIDIEERVPLARWQYNGAVSVIDRTGYKLSADHRKYRNLLLVVGKGAGLKAWDLTNAMAQAPQTSAYIYAAIRQNDRRWDLKLINDVIVRLPEDNISEALEQTEMLLIDQDLYHKDIRMVDLRVPGAPTLLTSAQVLEARKARLTSQGRN